MTYFWAVVMLFCALHATIAYKFAWKNEDSAEATDAMEHAALWLIASLICMGHLA